MEEAAEIKWSDRIFAQWTMRSIGGKPKTGVKVQLGTRCVMRALCLTHTTSPPSVEVAEGRDLSRTFVGSDEMMNVPTPQGPVPSFVSQLGKRVGRLLNSTVLAPP